MIFSHYAQEFWNVMIWRLEDINFQFSAELRPWISLACSAHPNFQL